MCGNARRLQERFARIDAPQGRGAFVCTGRISTSSWSSPLFINMLQIPAHADAESARALGLLITSAGVLFWYVSRWRKTMPLQNFWESIYW